MRREAMLKKLLVAAGVVFILLLISAELVLRHNRFVFNQPYFRNDLPFILLEVRSGVNIYQVDPVLFWKYRPRAVRKDWDVEINSLGFRDREFSAKKLPGVFRIVCIGDSCIGGHGLKLEETLAKQLELILNQHRTQGVSWFEVINAGVPGYSSYQGLKYLQRIIPRLAPDLVVAQFGYNDSTQGRYCDKKFNYWIYFKTQLLRGVLSRFKVGQYLAQVYDAKEEATWQVRVTPRDYRLNLENMRELARKNKARIIFIKPCKKEQLVFSCPEKDYLSPEPALDLFSLFQDYRNSPEEVYLDYEHPSALGNQLLARGISEKIKEIFR